MDNRPIGVFDSGLGGLTAVRELCKILPNESIVYFGDTGRIPYGTRGRDTIIKYAEQDIAFLLTKDVKYIMAACGTVSSTFPKEKSATLPVPYIGVVNSAAKAAVAASAQGRIGILGTSATIASNSYNKAILEILPTAQLTATACPLFVPLVENGYINKDNKITRLAAEEYLQEAKRANVDTLILGCTHYPLLSEILHDIMGSGVTLIDPGFCAAHSAKQELAKADLLSANKTEKTVCEYYVSDNVESFKALSKVFLKEYAGGDCRLASVD